MSKKPRTSETDEQNPNEDKIQRQEQVTNEPTHRLNADIPKTLYKRLRMRAVEEERSMKDIVIDSLNEYLSI